MSPDILTDDFARAVADLREALAGSPRTRLVVFVALEDKLRALAPRD